jgi:hypothetical protein
MLVFKQTKGLKIVCKKLGIFITIHIENINLTKIDSYHKAKHKHISHLGKLNKNINKFQQRQNA